MNRPIISPGGNWSHPHGAPALHTLLPLSNSQSFSRLSSLGYSCLLLAVLFIGFVPTAAALVHFDFDQKYYTHQDRQVWDFSIVRPDSVYHIFYHTIHEQTPSAVHADTIWHATSLDLKHWETPDPILTTGQGYWDEGAMWAPDVFFDHTQDRWMLAYTACDVRYNQRIAMAKSNDLYTWTKLENNPIIVPDNGDYSWNADNWWSDFRDPFVYTVDDTFHMLVTAKQYTTEAFGVLYHGVSLDLENWIDVGPFFVNDGFDPWRVLESPQYHILDGHHVLLFGEYDTGGISSIPNDMPGSWSMDDRQWIDYGYAPEVDEFDPGIPMFSRIAPFEPPATGLRSYVVRIDTLTIDEDGRLDAHQPHPLAESWASWSGPSNLAQPTFGDNIAWRGEESVGLVGNGFYGSKEYYQGPLSGRGSPGTVLGEAATGVLESHPFTITGTRMTLLVGGGHYPETCYVALVDALADTIIFSETGANHETMTLRQWDLTPYQGTSALIRIVDQETQEFGHINVDEIHEDFLNISSVSTDMPASGQLVRHRAYPNPFNPRTQISFELRQETPVSLRIHDLRGRLIWDSGMFTGQPGTNAVEWTGQTLDGQEAPAGTFLYRIETGGQTAASGKLSLVK